MYNINYKIILGIYFIIIEYNTYIKTVNKKWREIHWTSIFKYATLEKLKLQ